MPLCQRFLKVKTVVCNCKYLFNVFCHGNILINVPGKVPAPFLSHSVSCTESKIKNF